MTDERDAKTNDQTTTEIPDGVTVTPPETPDAPKPAGLWAAMARAQDNFGVPTKTKTAKVKGQSRSGTPFEYTYKYSSLDDLIGSVRPALNAEGIYMGQTAKNDGTRVTVTTFFRFNEEVWTSEPWTIAAESPDAQKLGSALTYARRHSMSASTGVAAEEDDDGQAAGETKGPTRKVSDPAVPERPRNSASKAPAAAPVQTAPEPAPDAPDASQTAAQRVPETGQKAGRGELAAYPGCINGKQVKRLFSIAQNHHVSNAALKAFLTSGGITASDRIPVDRYDGIIAAIQNGHVQGE